MALHTRILLLFGSICLLVAPGGALAAEKGTGFVQSVDVAGGSLVVDGTVYHVTPRTRIYAASGGRGELEDLRAVPAGRKLVSAEDASMVRFEAVQSRSQWMLIELQVVDRMPD